MDKKQRKFDGNFLIFSVFWYKIAYFGLFSKFPMSIAVRFQSPGKKVVLVIQKVTLHQGILHLIAVKSSYIHCISLLQPCLDSIIVLWSFIKQIWESSIGCKIFKRIKYLCCFRSVQSPPSSGSILYMYR